MRIQEFSQKGGFSQMTSKVDWFSVGFDEFDRINEGLESRGRTADDVISITPQYNRFIRERPNSYLVFFRSPKDATR